MQKTLKNHASLRGVSNANDAAIQLLSFKREQSVSVTTLTHKRHAFTMAEILLSLTIIGVVAAITLPSLMANINERTWNTQRKALYARMSQAIAMMPQVGGYGTLTEDAEGNVTEDTAAETFLTEGLSKVLKINNICDSEHLADCGIASKVTTLAGGTFSIPNTLVGFNSAFYGSISWESSGYGSTASYYQTDTQAAAFETQNGESVLLYYNPRCTPEFIFQSSTKSQPFLCANFVYDLNGTKGPNAVGKDVGWITALYSSDTSVVAPLPLAANAVGSSVVYTEAINLCRASDIESRLPNFEEASSMFYNKNLMGITMGDYWSSSKSSKGMPCYQAFGTGGRSVSPADSYSANVRCVKR